MGCIKGELKQGSLSIGKRENPRPHIKLLIPMKLEKFYKQ
jgi:hypothetical protein